MHQSSERILKQFIDNQIKDICEDLDRDFSWEVNYIGKYQWSIQFGHGVNYIYSHMEPFETVRNEIISAIC